MERYDVLKFISTGKSGTLSPENEVLAQLANDIRRATSSSGNNEKESCCCNDNVIILNEKEQRFAEEYAKANNLWISFFDIEKLGVPGPCGSEANTYVSRDGYVFKVNNMLHCGGSIVSTLEKFVLHNLIFPDTAYAFVGFTGFDGRSIYPIVKQTFIRNCKPANKTTIKDYMAALGFTYINEGIFQNNLVLVKDVLPKNVLTDSTDDVYVIDVEISLV